MVQLNFTEHTIQLAELAKTHPVPTLVTRVKNRVWKEVQEQIITN